MVKLKAFSEVLLGFVCLVLLWGAIPALATPPSTINIRGQLRDAAGHALSGDRAYQVRFFNAQTGGAQLGTTLTGTAHVSTEGVFNIPVVLPSEVLSAAQPWYELAVDGNATPNGLDVGDTFPERVAVNSVPFALEAGHVAVTGIGNGMVSETAFNALAGITGNLQALLNAKANTADVYTKTEVDTSQADQDTLINGKADVTTVYKKMEIDAQQADLYTAIATKANTTNVYTRTEVDGKLFSWMEVSGGDVQAEANHGYLLKDSLPLTVTLPPSGTIAVGDTVRVTAAGTGGWRVAQNTGQTIQATSLRVPDYNGSWTPRDSSSTWYCAASSADGTKLVAGGFSRNIYTSTDSGTTWTPRDSSRSWYSVASSADGTKLVACENAGRMYTSTDSGVTWFPRDVNRLWSGVASSADGVKLVACANGGSTGQIFTSTDSGVTWTPRETSRGWMGVASSADGTKLVACASGDQIYTSNDSGISWVPRNAARSWRCVASSYDGTKLVACASGDHIYTSNDSGETWIPRDTAREWRSVASSADGTKLVVSVYDGQLYTSTDSGVTWTPRESNRPWYGVATSADGNVLVGCAFGNLLYTYATYGAVAAQTTTGVTGGLSGGSCTAVELQYIGNDTFMPISYVGNLGVQ